MNNVGQNVPEHLDKVLGVQENQTTHSFEDNDFWILEYENTPFDKVKSYISVGLGRHLLKQPSGKNIRQELMFTILKKFEHVSIEKSLASLSLDFIDRHIPIPDNQVIPWQGGVFEDYEYSAVYCTSARHMPEEFEIINGNPLLVFVWLIPIFPEEREYIQIFGWESFEELIDEQQPNFFDLDRPRIDVKI
ncbi:MAG: suppressor of fused domain protein [Saccharospirillaceae bacterium]|nr:suppressor of fused domain protein [Pseudomonadales bacterium]NRB77584.1 suppressor of fused domain protein [Saccharospirillaceae bacterium]